MYQDDFCVRNGELLPGRFLQKSQIYKYITPQITALFRSRPPWASASHSCGGRGHLFKKFVLLNSTFRTCNLKVQISGFFTGQSLEWTKSLQNTGSESQIQKDKIPEKIPTPSPGVTGTGAGWSRLK